jgi:hypothetical protein
VGLADTDNAILNPMASTFIHLPLLTVEFTYDQKIPILLLAQRCQCRALGQLINGCQIATHKTQLGS